MLIDFPQVLDMTTQKCHDPMIDLRHYKFRKIKYNPFIDACDNLSLKEKILKGATKIRLGVYKRLLKAQEILRKKYGYSIRLFCGYRNKKTQDIMFKKYWAQNQKEFPNAIYHELYKKGIKLISPLRTWNGQINIPPHSTGGAVDIELIDKNEKLVNMGVDAKDAINVKPE